MDPRRSDADPDPLFHCDAGPNLAIHTNVDPVTASQNDAGPDPQRCLFLTTDVNVPTVKKFFLRKNLDFLACSKPLKNSLGSGSIQ